MANEDEESFSFHNSTSPPHSLTFSLFKRISSGKSLGGGGGSIDLNYLWSDLVAYSLGLLFVETNRIYL